MIQRFVEVHNHHNASFNSDTKQRDVTNPHGNTEVISEQALKNQAASQSVDCGENEDSSLGDGMKHHVEQQENNKENDRQNQLKPLFSPQLELVFTRPFVSKAGWQGEFLLEQIARTSNEAAVIIRVQVDVNVASQSAVFIADHGRSARKRDFCHFRNGDLC